MADGEVRDVGEMHSQYGTAIRFGVDGGDVAIAFGNRASVLLNAAQREEFSRLYFEAVRQAEAGDG